MRLAPSVCFSHFYKINSFTMDDILWNIHSCGKDDVWNEKSSKDGIQFMLYIESCLIHEISRQNENTMSTLATYRL